MLRWLGATALLLSSTAQAADPHAAGDVFRHTSASLARHVTSDGVELDGSAAATNALRKRWSAARGLIVSLLDRNPDIAPSQLARQAKAASLDIDPIRLDPKAYLVAARSGQFGTVFLLNRAADRHFRVALALDAPPAVTRSKSELAAWQPARAVATCTSQDSKRSWSSCGPMTVSRLIALPNERGGARRFAVLGMYVRPAGDTVPYQISVWRWDGRAATPLISRTFSQALEQPLFLQQDARGFALLAKEEYRAFPACDPCSGHQVAWRFDLPPTGIAPPVKHTLSPEMDLVDHLFASVQRHQPTRSFAAPEIVARVARMETDMLNEWRLLGSTNASTKRLCVDAIGFDRPQIFSIVQRGGKPWIAAMSSVAPHACDEPVSPP